MVTRESTPKHTHLGVVVGAILGLAKRLLQLFFDGESDVMKRVIFISSTGFNVLEFCSSSPY